MTVHQVVVAAAAHDAITNHARALQGALSARGPSRIYARHVDPALGGAVEPLHAFPEAPADAIVFHASIGEHEVTEFLLGRPEPLVVVYHNITPAEFFDDLDPRFARLLRDGRHELGLLRDRAVLALGVSQYNADELSAMGFDAVGVAPLVVANDRIRAEPDPETVERLRAGAGPVYLFVGQLMPHKRPDFLVQAFHILRTYLDPTSRLVLAGPARHEKYAAAVRQFVAELALPDVWVTGAVSDGVLAALFQGATAFVTASEHEGFCAPLVEAMSVDLPVVARRFAAIPETLGASGLVLEADDGPAVFAEAMLRIGQDAGLRRDLVASGRGRAEEVLRVDARGVLLDHLRRVVG